MTKGYHTPTLPEIPGWLFWLIIGGAGCYWLGHIIAAAIRRG